MASRKFKYEHVMASLPFMWLYKYYMEEEDYEDSISLFYALRYIAIRYSEYLPDNERRTNQVWCDWQRDRFQQGMINVNPVLLERCGTSFEDFLSRGNNHFTHSTRAGMFIVDPTYTKIVVMKCLMSNKYTVPKDLYTTYSDMAPGVRSDFEARTGLCSCHHLDTNNPFEIRRCASKHTMYFACGVPEDVVFPKPGSFHERCKFVEINKITPHGLHCDTGEKFAIVVTASLKKIKTYCQREDRLQISPKSICELCETMKEELDGENKEEDEEKRAKVDGENKEEGAKEMHMILLVILDPTLSKILLRTDLDSCYNLIKFTTSKPLTNPERLINHFLRNRLLCRMHRVDMVNIVVNSEIYTMYFVTNLLTTPKQQDKKLKLFKLDSITEEGLHAKDEMSFMVMFHLERIKQYCNYRKLEQIPEEADEEGIRNATVSRPLSNTVPHGSERDRCKYGAILIDPTYTKIVLVRLGNSPKLNFPINLDLMRVKIATDEAIAIKAVEFHCGYDCRGKLKANNSRINVRVSVPYSLYIVQNVHEFTAFYPRNKNKFSESKNKVNFYKLSEITSLDISNVVFHCLPQIERFCCEARSKKQLTKDQDFSKCTDTRFT